MESADFFHWRGIADSGFFLFSRTGLGHPDQLDHGFLCVSVFRMVHACPHREEVERFPHDAFPDMVDDRRLLRALLVFQRSRRS